MQFNNYSILILFVMVIFLFNKVNMLEKKNIENFNNNKLIEHTTNTDNIKTLINEQYNIDIEAIRNLGAISKSLLTGKNYHNTNPGENNEGTLIIPANVTIQGNVKILGHTNIINGKHLYFEGPNNSKKAQIFFNNEANGLEIAQRGCDTLRLYQNSNGFDLKTDHIKTTGGTPFKINNKLEVTGDLKTTGNAEIGPAYIGKYAKTNGDYAEFTHKNRSGNSSKYSFLSDKNGNTFINTSHASEPVYIRRNNSNTNASISFHIHRILTRYNQNRVNGHHWDDHDAGIVVWNKLERGLMEAGDILYTKGRSHNWRNHLGSVIMHPHKRDDNYWWNEVEFCNHHRHHWNLKHNEAGTHLRWGGGGDMNENLHTT